MTVSQSREPVVQARNLRRDFGRGEGLVRAVDGADLDVARGETVAVMGPSGCGKSTLLHLRADEPTGSQWRRWRGSMPARCVTDWAWPQVQVALSRRLLLHRRRQSGWCPMATFRTYAEILRLDHPMMKIRKATTTWRPSRYRPAEIEQAMRAEPGVVLGDVLQRTGGAYETTTRLTPKFREDIREIAELTSDDELLSIAELPDVPVSLEHLRHADPQTRIVVGYRLDVTPAESPRLRRRLALPPDPGITLHFAEVVLPGTSDRFWGAMRFDINGHGRSGSQADNAA